MTDTVPEVDAKQVITLTFPPCLQGHAIGWNNDHICARLLTLLVDAIILFSPGLQGRITEDLQRAKATKRNRWIRLHTERLQKCVVIFSTKLRDELEIALSLQPGQQVACEVVLGNVDCITRACQAAVVELNTAKKGHNTSRRKKYAFSYFFRWRA